MPTSDVHARAICAVLVEPAVDPGRSIAAVVKRLLAAASLVAVIGMAVPTHAEDAIDELFLGGLNEAGIEYADLQQAIEAGKAVCRSIAEGNTINQTVRGVKNANPYLSATMAAQFVAIARAKYCSSGG